MTDKPFVYDPRPSPPGCLDGPHPDRGSRVKRTPNLDELDQSPEPWGRSTDYKED